MIEKILAEEQDERWFEGSRKLTRMIQAAKSSN